MIIIYKNFGTDRVHHQCKIILHVNEEAPLCAMFLDRRFGFIFSLHHHIRIAKISDISRLVLTSPELRYYSIWTYTSPDVLQFVRVPESR